MNDGEHETIPPLERIAKSIIVLRSEKVLLDAELAELSGVPTKALNQAAKRNIERAWERCFHC